MQANKQTTLYCFSSLFWEDSKIAIISTKFIGVSLWLGVVCSESNRWLATREYLSSIICGNSCVYCMQSHDFAVRVRGNRGRTVIYTTDTIANTGELWPSNKTVHRRPRNLPTTQIYRWISKNATICSSASNETNCRARSDRRDGRGSAIRADLRAWRESPTFIGQSRSPF